MIEACPECGQQHDGVDSRTANVPEFTHLFTCPTTGRRLFWSATHGFASEEGAAMLAQIWAH